MRLGSLSVDPLVFGENQLLAVTLYADIDPLAPSFDLVELRQRDVLSSPNIRDDFAYFPLGGICSFIATARNDIRVEVGLVGQEGFVGTSIVLQAEHDPNEVIVQVEGRALRIPNPKLLEAFNASAAFRTILLRYVYILGIQTSQTALANGVHTIEMRLARWLLMCMDRVGATFPMTHEFLSIMLSVRRAGITEALHVLEGKMLIRSSRGMVVVIDRQGLQVFAGAAYGLPEREYERLIKNNGQ
jgi:CRP-like cAMP-binding protein